MVVLGSLAVIAGTFLVNTSSFRLLHFIPASLSRIDDLEHAWSELRAYDAYQGELDVITSITPEVSGFRVLLRLLERHGRLNLGTPITSIQIESQMIYGNDLQRIGRYVVQVEYKSESQPAVMAWVEDVSRWIEDECLHWSLSFGFPVLCGGLILSLVPLLLPARARKESDRGCRKLRWRSAHLTWALAIAGLAAVGVFAAFVSTEALLGDLVSLALILTLLALIRYAYDTYRVAEMSTIPSASLSFVQPDRSRIPFLLNSLPKNHSRIPIECWCDVHAKVQGCNIDLDGFYGGEQPWNLQPYQEPRGVLDLAKLLAASGTGENDLRNAWSASTDPNERHNMLRLDVEFWYRTIDGRFQSPHFWEGYYFDFDKNALVLHPHLEQSSS